jgi:hypothetical protein
MIMKLHLFHSPTEKGMPSHVRKKYYEKGMKGTICGYIRAVSKSKNEVTCFYCLKIIERENALKRLRDNTPTKEV